MRGVIVIILSLIVSSSLANDISKINGLKKDAEKAFKAKNYEKAISTYATLLDSMDVSDDASRLNMAHAQFETQDAEGALKNYQKLVLSKDDKIKSLAYQQLGNLSSNPKDLSKALSYFKESIKSDPFNEAARYNYEMVKKKLENQEDQNQDQDQQNEDQENQDEENQENQENQDQQNQEGDQDQQDSDQQQDQENSEEQNQENSEQNQDQESQDQSEQENQDQQGQEGEENQDQQEQDQQQGEQGEEGEQEQQQSQEGEEQEEQEGEEQATPSTKQKLEEMNLSEEKARMILEALKNSEIQYIQQNQRRSTQKQDSGKPDW
ncbi:tetratricopeptide repeat protein [Reichenbachiella versicolor]|uniref:tetratricopeptide repeat protein n=1 Tax=Reichenbachiella versicolor TaxID=1821036 RepID=UPI0013A574AF|nr:hypothetical protein [Reichenbachiella versicolor]